MLAIVETAESHIRSFLPLGGGIQDDVVFILFLQLYPSATAIQTLDNTESSTCDRITDLPFCACMYAISSSQILGNSM